MKIVIGSDLAAYEFKLKLADILRGKGHEVTDVGCFSSEEGEYPYYGQLVGRKVASGEYERGIVICGTGNGITMAANKVHGVRAALCYNTFAAIMSREHNNANVLGLSSWMLSIEEAEKIADVWLFGKFAEGRHCKRIKMLADIEEGTLA